jgi:hypothetical protein
MMVASSLLLGSLGPIHKIPKMNGLFRSRGSHRPQCFFPLLAHIPIGLFLKCAIRLQTSANATEGQSSELPPGWEQRIDANGQFYVVDHTSHTSTWTDPHSPPRGEQRTNAPPAILDEYNAADRITLAGHIGSIASKTYTVRKFLPSFA